MHYDRLQFWSSGHVTICRRKRRQPRPVSADMEIGSHTFCLDWQDFQTIKAQINESSSAVYLLEVKHDN